MKQLTNLFFFLIVLLVGSNPSYSQNKDAIDSAFMKLTKLPPMEKLYVHTDKTTYASGSTIWLKAYLVTATEHMPLGNSQFVYVELFDKTETLISRIKIKRKNGMFAGNIKLPKALQEGDYCLKAYTSWMLNQDDEFLFRKMIKVKNFIRNKYKATIQYDIKGSKKMATVSFRDKEGKPVVGMRVQCKAPEDENEIKTFYRHTGSNGDIRFAINSDSLQHNKYVDVLLLNDEKQFRKRFCLPSKNDDFDLQFFPEGGKLIGECLSTIAFKAVGVDGLSRHINGCILNQNNDTLQHFESLHKGMGSFFMISDTTSQYRVLAWMKNGNKKEFAFPKTVNKGIVLSVNHARGKVQITFRTKGKGLVKPFHILAHSGENMLFKQVVDQLQYTIETKFLPEGIINFVLLDGLNQPISSRLIFNKKTENVNINVKSNKEHYNRREEVKLAIMLDKPVQKGHFSISVTDNDVVTIDSLADNIKSSLLLTSDLKGFVEDPNYYFMNKSDSVNKHLDLLMLTQGWRRFDISKIIHQESIVPTHYLELGQTLIGKFTGSLIRTGKNAEITALAVEPPMFAKTTTDEKGNFIFNQLNFKDSTVFTIQSQKYTAIRKEPAGVIEIVPDSFPQFGYPLPVKEYISSTIDDKSNLSLQRLMYDGGMRHVVMDEVVITAADKTTKYQEKYGLSADITDAGQLKSKFPVPVRVDMLIKMISGGHINNNKVYFRNNPEPAEILLNNMMMSDLRDVSDLSSDDLESVVIIKDGTAALYSRNGGKGGVVLINMREGNLLKRKINGVLSIMPLGYQKKAEFYMPKYEVDSIRKSNDYDLRSTIYWNPTIQIDSTNQVQIKFYAADLETNYTYIIEGITKDGEICRTVGTIHRKEDE